MKQTLIKFIAFGALALGCLAWATPAVADPVRGATILCYLLANNPSPTIGVPYEPDPLFSFNAQKRAGGISVTKTATGTYLVTCAGVGGGGAWGKGGHVQVSANGDGVNTFCHVGSWSTGSANFTASVDCFGKGTGPGGGPAPADSQFDLLFVW